MKQLALLLTLFLTSSTVFNSCSALLNAFVGSAPDSQPVQQATAAVEEAVDRAAYEIVREDRSFYDEESGLPLIEVYYDVVRVNTPTTSADAINARILARCEEFLSRRDQYADYLNGPYISTDYPYMSTSEAAVTHNSGGILSILSTQSWFMGGVFNSDGYGMTFDLATGQLVTLAELCPEREEELRTTALAYMDEAYGDHELGDREETLASYSLEEIPFYIREGEIILTFPTYTFASGAAGATVIETGIYIG